MNVVGDNTDDRDLQMTGMTVYNGHGGTGKVVVRARNLDGVHCVSLLKLVWHGRS